MTYAQIPKTFGTYLHISIIIITPINGVFKSIRHMKYMNYESSTDVGCQVYQYLLAGTEENGGLVRLIGPPAGN
jgi:hypothetical protein